MLPPTPLTHTSPSTNIECAMNIGPQQRRRRMTFGLVTLSLGAVIAIALIALGVDRWWRLGLFLLFSAGGTGIFQALDKT